jgi:hypothetical protein
MQQEQEQQQQQQQQAAARGCFSKLAWWEPVAE